MGLEKKTLCFKNSLEVGLSRIAPICELRVLQRCAVIDLQNRTAYQSGEMQNARNSQRAYLSSSEVS